MTSQKTYLLCTLSQIVCHQNKGVNQERVRQGIQDIKDLTWERGRDTARW